MASTDGMTTYEVLSFVVTALIGGGGLVTAMAALRSSTNVKRSLDIQTAAAREDDMVARVTGRVESRLGIGRRRRERS